MTQLTDKVFAVEVPDGAENVRVSQLIGTPKLFADIPGALWAVKLPPGTYRFLFTTGTATEEDARKVVGEAPWVNYIPQNLLDMDSRCWLGTGIECMHSLLRLKNLDLKNNYAIIEKF